MLRIPPDHRLDVAAPSSDAVLPALAAGARAQTDATLALCAGIGLVVAAIAVIVVPLWAPLALAALAVAAFGAWGIVDRVAIERGAIDAPTDSDRAAAGLRLTRAAVAAIGLLAALGFVAAVLGLLLGPFS